MSINALGSVDVPLSLFSSLDTELSPSDIPEGISPDNQDVVFTPGTVSTRPGLQRVFTSVLDGGEVVYEKSFVLPNGNVKNLYLTTLGNMFVEDVTNTPGTASVLFTTLASRAESVTALGREYIALSDGVHGFDVPVSYDGENVYRVTQDGPGAPPSVQSVALPAVAMTSSGNTLTRQDNIVTGVTATPNNLQIGYQVQISGIPDSNSSSVVQSFNSGFQTATSAWSFVGAQWRSNFNPGTSGLGAFQAGGFGFTIPSSASILGVTVTFGINSQATTTGTVAQVSLWNGALLGTAKSPGTPITTTITANTYGGSGDLWGAGLTPAIVNNPNFAFAVSVTADSVRVFLDAPYTIQVHYTLSGSSTVATISSIVVDNEINPGQALVTTAGPHGLLPQEFVSIVGVQPGTVADIVAAQWVAGVTTATTATDHNLVPGSLVQVTSVTTATGSTTFSFDGTFTVATVPSPNEITYIQVPITATDPDVINATANTGSITVSWPVPDTPTPTYFQVISAPTPTTFYIGLNYADATWTSGTVGFIWEGTFFVTNIINSTTFQYQQYGPNGATTAIGTATPWGQAAPGLHQLQVSFLTATGAITEPSPPVTFVANGGQYIQVSNIPIGPPSVVARILLFTGSGGDFFFYIPVPAFINGQIVSTATQINDNTTTSVLLDFSDNTLYAAIGTSVPGNNLQEQIVLGPMGGFFTYSSRLQGWGDYNKVENLLNMGFNGGALPSAPTQPTGWGPGGGVLVAGRFNGGAWQANTGATATLVQSFYRDAYGNAIGLSNTFYSVRVYMTAGTFTANIFSASLSFSDVAVITATTTGWYTANFPIVTPASIPSDMTLILSNTSGSTIDEVMIYYTEQPFNDTEAKFSYEDNLEGMDGLTGIAGPEDDLTPIRNWGVIRDTLYCVTGGSMHETNDNGTTEPSGWGFRHVADNCGAWSISSIARNVQGIGSAGKEWMTWSGPDGAQIFTGQQPMKISQEIESLWESVNESFVSLCWASNDQVAKRCYYGVPTGPTPTMSILMMDYRNLDGEGIVSSPPVHISFTGKMIASDLTRKWTRWNVPARCGALMYRPGDAVGAPSFVLGGGLSGSQVYTLNDQKFSDDDYGRIFSYYITYFFVSHEAEQALQVTSHRKLYQYGTTYIQGVGFYNVTPYGQSLENPFPTTPNQVLSMDAFFDLEFGLNVEASRCAFKIQVFPLLGQTDAYFSLEKMIINMRPAPWSPVRGTNTGSF